MRYILLLVTIGLVYSQSDIVRVQDQCQCENLLNQQDCELKNGCTWNNAVNSYCSKQQQIQEQSFCQSIVNKITNCAKTLGCAYFNSTCQPFPGCASFYYKSTSACQSVSFQCISDGNKCVDINQCINYQSETQCNTYPSSSGARSCKWVYNKCQDKTCEDAPQNYNTDKLCQTWLSDCITYGRGCTSVLYPCKYYKKYIGCKNLFGADGKCIDSFNENCRAIICQDAPQSYNTNLQCAKFQIGCYTTGKGCTDQLIKCSEYNKSIGCQGLIGLDGPCTFNKESYKQNCKVLECSDAPIKLTTNKECNQFVYGCITNGRGCVNTVQSCSKYLGTKTICQQYLGIEGYCDGIDARIQNCRRRLCEDAPSSQSLNDALCSNFQIGCVSNGMRCVQKLSPCNEYYETANICQILKGSDGNCTSNNSQQDYCKVKDCSLAVYQTNKQCQDYSYTCITNGQTCLLPQSCELIFQDQACLFNYQCQSAQVCVDMSDCINFITMSLCLQNVQNYKSGNIIYKRQCKWNQETQTCTNQSCNEISNNCTTDQQCSEILNGCLTDGSKAVDISQPCSSYYGNTQTCQKFKGDNGASKCSQFNNLDNQPCQAISSCQQAKQFLSQPLTEQICQSFLKDCSFDGLDNCVIGDCTKFYGTQYTCSLINNAISQGQQQPCWKINDASNQLTSCEPRECTHAIPSTQSPFNSNYLCQLFLRNCIWNGLQTGGCVSQGQCNQYTGNLQTCQQQTDINNHRCTKKSNFCRPIICENKIVPSNLATLEEKASFCQQITNENGFNCQLSTSNQNQCQTPTPANNGLNCQNYVALEDHNKSKYFYCQSLVHSYKGITCIYDGSTYCTTGICTMIFVGDSAINDKASYCQQIIDRDNNKCGIAGPYSTMCSIQQCSDILTTYNEYTCSNYADGCRYHTKSNKCYKQSPCATSIIPFISPTEIQKVIYCSELFFNNAYCSYEPTIALTACIQAQTCDQFNVPSSIVTFEEKLQFCKQRTESGQLCVYNSYVDQVKCSAQKPNCQDYLLSGSDSKLQNQIFCQSLRNSAFQQCTYQDGIQNCIDYNNDCQNHPTYGQDLLQNQNLCAQLTQNDIFQCYYQEGTATCFQVNCETIQYPSYEKCNTFNCVFDGQICFKKMVACSSYFARNDGLGSFYNCGRLSDLNNQLCGYSSGANCSYRSCSDQVDNPNTDTCASYNQCVFNGSSCQDPIGACTNYIALYQPIDQSYHKNAQFCNTLIGSDGNPCTYHIQELTCRPSQQNCSQYFMGNTNPLAQLICSYLQDINLRPCSYISGDYCSYKQCSQLSLANNDSECNSFLKGCESEGSSQCDSADCSDAPSLTTDLQCQQFKKGCLTNGFGCIDQSATCQSYKGTKLNCMRFKGSNGTYYCDNYDQADEQSQCINRFCELNKIAKSQDDCNLFYPLNNSKYCVWNGLLGCKQPSKCIEFIGTADTCPTFKATDGPCYGIGSNQSPQQCIPNECLKAPKTYSTNKQCQNWHSDCITSGFGCIFKKTNSQCSQMLTRSSCLEQSSSGCGMAQQCKTIQQNCSDFKTGYECNNYLLNGQSQITCAWNPSTNQCGPLICELLPTTLITDISCNSALQGCITNGAGCMSIGSCLSYDKMACNIAQSTDIQKRCIWKDSICRPIQCSDNLISQTDSDCNIYLSGCRTTGLGCASTTQCSDFISARYCLYDTFGNSCLWYKNSQSGNCIKFTQCSDLAGQTQEQCQTASSFCTTNGSHCIPLTKCQDFKLQLSCVKGVDGVCGWKQSQCYLFTKCEDSNTNCQEWGIQCTYDKLLGHCRLSTCEDNFFTTSAECQKYNKNCTSNGTQCIQISQCNAYKSEQSCQFGTDGRCNWIQNKCKMNECQDWNFNSSSQCAANFTGLDCVSNSTNCVPRNNCSNYAFKDSCQSGGLDGLCVFTPQNNTEFGTCAKFQDCQQALSNQTLCNLRSDACYFNKNTNQCLVRTCTLTTVAAHCQPIPSFDLSRYQICVLSGPYCLPGNPTELNSSQICFKSSAQTYTWNPKTLLCTQCVQSTVNNQTDNQTTNQSFSNFKIIGFLIYLILM